MRSQPWTTILPFYYATITSNTSFKVLPQIVLLDLRDNNPLLCQDIVRFQPSKSIKIISDCKYSSTKIPIHSTSEIPTTHETKTTTYHSSSPNSRPSISRNFTTHPTTQISRMSNLVHLSADCNSAHCTNNSNFISINHSMLEIKTVTATTIGNAPSAITKCRKWWGGCNFYPNNRIINLALRI